MRSGRKEPLSPVLCPSVTRALIEPVSAQGLTQSSGARSFSPKLGLGRQTDGLLGELPACEEVPPFPLGLMNSYPGNDSYQWTRAELTAPPDL